MIIQTKIYSGDVLEIEEYFSPRPIGKNIPRGPNRNLTPAQQKERNARNAQKKLSRSINTNFGKNDLFLTLTYAGDQPDDIQAEKDLKNYIRRVRAYRRKHGLSDLKYVSVTEGAADSSDHRVHHHIVMSGMNTDDAISIWTSGRVIASKLDKYGDYTGLANYISKDAPKEHKKRWSQSRNLKKPKIVKKELKRSSGRILKPPKGYKVIVQEMYASDATGQMQYMKAIKIGGTDYAGNKTG